MNILFDRINFFPLKKKIFVSDFIKIIENKIQHSRSFNDYEIEDISSLDYIRKKSVLFISNIDKIPKNIADIHIFTDNENIFKIKNLKNIHLLNNLDEIYNLLLNLIFYHDDNLGLEDNFNKINNSYVSNSSTIDPSTEISANCIIGRGVKIGKNCIIKSNVSIKNAIIGNNVIIGDNTVIGSTGFGFNLKNLGSKNILPHIGIVYIEDNVRFGSNCTVDRAKIDYTFIGKNSMLDNQIHIGHNVKIGSNACIAAQTGISGSVIIGSNVIIGGQSGFAGHIVVGDNVTVAAKSGVTKNINKNSIVAGFPAVDIKEWKKSIINLKKYGHK